MTDDALTVLSARARNDVEMVAHPRADWMPERRRLDGAPILDVLIVGAGQGGLALGFQLFRDRVRNIQIIDRAAPDQVGSWRTHARMRHLRSPKDYTGPDLGIPSLTYEAWHVARYGRGSWQSIELIHKDDWVKYLDWYKETLQLPVQNECELCHIEPIDDCLRAHLADRDGDRVIHARKFVLATGQDGLGRWWTPPEIEALPPERWANAADAIEFSELQGKRVAVVGAGASAADNVATALEAGAAEATMLCRRPELQLVQPYRWLTFAGFLRHLGEMDDAWRWRFMNRILSLREGIPPQTFQRMAAHQGFRLLQGAPVTASCIAGNDVVLETPQGAVTVDYVIAGTGIDIDPGHRPEVAEFADKIARWQDRYQPPPEEANTRLARYPYLGPNQELMEREPGSAPFLKNIHDFTIATTMSLGPSGCSINALAIAVPKLAAGITRGLFADDIETHFASLMAYDEPMFRLEDIKWPAHG